METSKKVPQKLQEDISAILGSNIFTQLNISDPTTIQDQHLKSTTVPGAIDISFAGVPSFLEEVWKRLQLSASPNLQNMLTPERKAIFFRTVLLMLQAKVAHAQVKAEEADTDMEDQYEFSDMDLRKIDSVSKRVVTPVAIAIEAVGNFTMNGQFVTPRLISHEVPALSGALNFAPTKISTLVAALARPVPMDQDVFNVSQILNALPNINWDIDQGAGMANLTAASVALWAPQQKLPLEHRSIYLELMKLIDFDPGFVRSVNLRHGNGSTAQAVRYPEENAPDEQRTNFYTTVLVPQYETQLSLALLYGFEHQCRTRNRFSLGIDNALVRGRGNRHEARHALVWM